MRFFSLALPFLLELSVLVLIEFSLKIFYGLIGLSLLVSGGPSFWSASFFVAYLPFEQFLFAVPVSDSPSHPLPRQGTRD
jgi:hypothetical protein